MQRKIFSIKFFCLLLSMSCLVRRCNQEGYRSSKGYHVNVNYSCIFIPDPLQSSKLFLSQKINISKNHKTKLIDIISSNSIATITGHNCKNNPKKLNFRSPQSYWLSAKKYWVNTNRLKKYNLPGGRIAWHWLRQMKVMGPHLEYFLLTQTVDWRKHQWKWRRPHNLATWYNFLE